MIAELQGIAGASMPGVVRGRAGRRASSAIRGRRCALRYQARAARVPRRLQFRDVTRPALQAIASRNPQPTLESNDQGQSGKKQKDENDASERDFVDTTKHDDAKHRSRYQRRQTDGQVDEEL
jgi:hypothetical protein